MADDFTPADATDVAHKCTVATTLNNHPLRPNDTLADYGVSTSEHILLIKTRIRTNSDFGLPYHDRSIDPNALKDLDLDWRMADLSNVVFDESFVSPSAMPIVAARSAEPRTRIPSIRQGGGVSQRTPSARLIEFTRQNPIEALLISTTIGILVGFLLGHGRR
ncbi:MAG TPA: hypothetical protein VJU86_16980 [Pyrinomonadaceae bacterium]|nr:hypothetical protein [Pyrinomonadaceae bacterium]